MRPGMAKTSSAQWVTKHLAGADPGGGELGG